MELVSNADYIPSQRTAEESYYQPTHIVPELGRVSLLHSRLVQLPNDMSPRLRRTMAVNLGSTEHCVRITEPSDDGAQATAPLDSIVMLHGYTEMIDAGTGKNLHDAIAPHFPDKRIISIATDGVGRYCHKVGWREGLTKSFRSMAIDRHRLINVVGGGGSISLFDVSMGSMIGLELLDYNTRLPQESFAMNDQDRRLDIEAVIHHSSAHVTRGRIGPDVLMRFPTHICCDSLKMQLALKAFTPGHAAVVRALPRSLPALTGNGLNILKGVDAKKRLAAARDYRTGYIIGQNDPLGQRKQMLQLATLYPDTVKLHIKPHTGHAACMDARSAAADFATMHDTLANSKF